MTNLYTVITASTVFIIWQPEIRFPIIFLKPVDCKSLFLNWNVRFLCPSHRAHENFSLIEIN